MKNLIYKIQTYGFKRVLKYLFIETNYLFRRVFFGSYSQQGEDLYLLRQFPKDYKGFYVDVGANDPFRFSNTCLFYNRGWRGINIEPNLVKYRKIDKYRTRDINLNIGVGEVDGKLQYYRFLPDTLNTFSKEEADSYVSQGYSMLGVIDVDVKRFENVLEKFLPNRECIDFISIDTEGFDIDVLKGMNVSKFRPHYVCVESVRHSVLSDGVISDSVKNFLSQNGYSEIYSNGLNSIYSAL